MKYTKGAFVMLPWLGSDETGEVTRNISKLTLRNTRGGSIDRRRFKRTIRKFVRDNLERTIHTSELRAIMRNIQPLSEWA